MALRQLVFASFENEAVRAWVEYDDASSPARATRYWVENNGLYPMRIQVNQDGVLTSFVFNPGDSTSRALPSGGPNRIDVAWSAVDANGVPLKVHFINVGVSVSYPYSGD